MTSHQVIPWRSGARALTLAVLSIATLGCNAPETIVRLNAQLLNAPPAATRPGPPANASPTAPLAAATPVPTPDFEAALATAVALAAARDPDAAEPTPEVANLPSPTPDQQVSLRGQSVLGQRFVYCSHDRARAFQIQVEGGTMGRLSRDRLRLLLAVRATNVGREAARAERLAKLVDDRERQFEQVDGEASPEIARLARALGLDPPGWPVAPGETRNYLWIYDIPADAQRISLSPTPDEPCRAPAKPPEQRTL